MKNTTKMKEHMYMEQKYTYILYQYTCNDTTNHNYHNKPYHRNTQATYNKTNAKNVMFCSFNNVCFLLWKGRKLSLFKTLDYVSPHPLLVNNQQQRKHSRSHETQGSYSLCANQGAHYWNSLRNPCFARQSRNS